MNGAHAKSQGRIANDNFDDDEVLLTGFNKEIILTNSDGKELLADPKLNGVTASDIRRAILNEGGIHESASGRRNKKPYEAMESVKSRLKRSLRLRQMDCLKTARPLEELCGGKLPLISRC